MIIGMDKKPVFGQIELFVCMPSSDDWCFVVSGLQTVDFSAHYHSYRVNYTSSKVSKVVTFDGLVDFHAVCCGSMLMNRLSSPTSASCRLLQKVGMLNYSVMILYYVGH